MQMSTVRKIKCLKLYLSKQHQGQLTIFLRKRFEKMTIAADYNNNIYHEIKYKTLKSVIPKKVELTAHRTFHFKECIPSKNDRRKYKKAENLRTFSNNYFQNLFKANLVRPRKEQVLLEISWRASVIMKHNGEKINFIKTTTLCRL